jgi:hypothetical protein
MSTTSQASEDFNLFSLKFLNDFIPKQKSDTQSPIKSNDFSRDRRLTLPIVSSSIWFVPVNGLDTTAIPRGQFKLTFPHPGAELKENS